MTAVVIGIIASVLSGVVWWITNRLPKRTELKNEKLDKLAEKEIAENDQWANR